MTRRYAEKKKRERIRKIISIPIFIIFAVAAVYTGMAAGDLIFSIDSGIVESIDSQSFKDTLNTTFPIIDTIYNSGNINVSLSSEIGRLIRNIFDFDLGTPITILNAQSSLFNRYYYNEYQLYLAQGYEEKGKEFEVADNNRPDKEDKQQPDETDTTPKQGDNITSDGVASSIFFDEADEQKDFSDKKSISAGEVTIQNQSNIKIEKSDIDAILKEPLNIKFDRKGPKILIYHTHTTEGYVRNASELEKNKKESPSYTSDAKYSVVRVGDQLAEYLEKTYDIQVIHNGTVHGNYSKSLKTIESYLKSYPSIKIIFDIHRDGLAADKPKLRLAKKINGKSAAQVMFVVGTNGSGLKHPKWKDNLKLAVKLQQKLNEEAPGLARPIYISNNRYNQHMADGALIIEIGADGNTIEEALESTKYVAKAISEVIK